METKSGRSSRVSVRSTSSSCLSGSDVDLLLERMGAFRADTRKSMDAVLANMGAMWADTRNCLEASRTALGAVSTPQVEIRGVLGTVRHRLERLETSPASKFVAGLDLNPSLSNEMTAAPNVSVATRLSS